MNVCVYARSNKRYLETTSLVGWNDPGRWRVRRSLRLYGGKCINIFTTLTYVALYLFLFLVFRYFYFAFWCARIRDPNRIGKLDISTANAAFLNRIRLCGESSLNFTEYRALFSSHAGIDSIFACRQLTTCTHSHEKCHTYGSSLARMRSKVRVRYFMVYIFAYL